MKHQGQVKSADAVIDCLGGTDAVAKLLGVKASAVSNWRVRGLPPETFYALSNALKAKGLFAAPALWRQREAI